MTDPTVGWLLEGDPSIVWQAQRDLAELPEANWAATRLRVAREGWGRELLDHQDPEGTWGGGLYQPKWTSTTYTLLLLRRMGLDPSTAEAMSGARRLLDDARWVDGGVSYWRGHHYAEKCVNAMVLSICSYFDLDDPRIDDIASYLMAGRLDDGGWNCRDHVGEMGHSSFHTTISVLEALAEWGRRAGPDGVEDSIRAGNEFMLAHHLFRSHTTGEVINKAWTKFSFPPRWHYDVLRGLEHLRDAGAYRDHRAEEAVDLLRRRRRGDGRWPVGPRHSGETFLTMDRGSEGGRWNTLRARRVLAWWET